MRRSFFERRLKSTDPRGEQTGEFGDGEFLANAGAGTVEECCSFMSVNGGVGWVEWNILRKA
jgi:hypothetical protein